MTKHHITIGKRRFVMQKASADSPLRTADGTLARWTIYELLPTTEDDDEHKLLGNAVTLLEAKGVLEQAVLLRKGEKARGRWGEATRTDETN